MCAHAVSVRLRRLEGVQSVTISLNEGRADLELKADNSVTLEQVHTIVKQAGFTPRAARITARAQVAIEKDTPLVRIAGTGESFRAVASKPLTRAALEQQAGATVIIEGLIDPPEESTEPRIAITSIAPAPAAPAAK